MLPGAALQDSNFIDIIHDIALLHSLGIKLVLVHGSRPQIDSRLKQSDIHSTLHGSLRITEKQHLSEIIQAIGEAKTQIEAALSTGLPNSPMHGSSIRSFSGNFIAAKPWGVVDGIDLQHTGKVRKVDTAALGMILNNKAIALVSPLGYSPTGEVFNLSFIDVATEIASSLQADKLIAYTADNGFCNQQSNLLRQLTLQECAAQLSLLDASHEHSQSLQACFEACKNGVNRAHMISYKTDGALLQELFTRDGSGTLVHNDTYETIRAATINDVGGILELIEPLEKQGVLVRRSRELLESEINQFTVMEMDGTIVACAALYIHANNAELACVATHLDYQKGGRAATLLRAIEQQAIYQGVTQLFVLTTQTAHWFMEQGFQEANLDQLPESKKDLYNFQRNSKIFTKALS
jgi:amino-acid N-acetyltransferase